MPPSTIMPVGLTMYTTTTTATTTTTTTTTTTNNNNYNNGAVFFIRSDRENAHSYSHNSAIFV